MIRTSVFALALTFVAPHLRADETPAEENFNEDILIFAGEIRNFVETAQEVKDLNAGEQTPAVEKELEDKIKILQMTSARVADVYFHVSDESNREQLTVFLGSTLKTNKDLKNYFVFIGNAFASEAQKLIEARGESMKKIHIWSTVGGVVLGLAGGYVFLKYAGNGSLLNAGLVAIGIAAVASGVGYSARYFIPVNQDVGNAKDFLARYPKGEDFLQDLDNVSPDLALGFSDLEEGNE